MKATAAEALEEVDPKVQKSIVESLDSERAADIVEEMDPDAAADLLGDLSEERTEQILVQMEPEAQQDVVELLEHREETAAGRMTTDFLRCRSRRPSRTRSTPCANSKAASKRSARSTWWIPTELWSGAVPLARIVLARLCRLRCSR